MDGWQFNGSCLVGSNKTEACTGSGNTKIKRGGKTYCVIDGERFRFSQAVACTVEEQPTTLKIDWSIDSVSSQEVLLVFGGVIFLWALGLAAGVLISSIRRFRL